MSEPTVGVQFHGQWGSIDDARRVKVLDLNKAANIPWVRIDLEWRYVEQTGKGVYDQGMLDRYDFLFSECRKRGLKVLGIVVRTPDWANPNTGADGTGPPLKPSDFADFCTFAANRWKLDAYEIWNEEDPSQTFWTGTPTQYVALLKLAFFALRSVQPSAPVVLGGIASNDAEYLRSLYSLGAGPFFDVVATHPYQQPTNFPPSTPDSPSAAWNYMHFPAVLEVMKVNGDGSKPVWFTEFGYSTHANTGGEANWNRGVNEQQQADFLLEALRIAGAWPNVEKIFFYKIDNDAGQPNVQLANYGIVNYDLTPKLAYTALKNHLSAVAVPPPPVPDVPTAIVEIRQTLDWMHAPKPAGLGYDVARTKRTHAHKALVALQGVWSS